MRCLRRWVVMVVLGVSVVVAGGQIEWVVAGQGGTGHHVVEPNYPPPPSSLVGI